MLYPFLLTMQKISGVWQVKGNNRFQTLLYGFYHYFTIWTFAFYHYSILTDLILHASTFSDVNVHLCEGTFGPIYLTKAILLCFTRDELLKLWADLENHLNLPDIGVNDADKARLKNADRHVFMLFLIGIVFCTLQTILWVLYPLMQEVDQSYIFAVPFYVPHNGLYCVVYVHQIIMLVAAGFFIVSYELYFVASIEYVCAYVDILEFNMWKIKGMYQRDGVIGMPDSRDPKRGREMLTACVNIHQEILNQSKQINKLYNLPVLTQVLCGTLLIAVMTCDLVLVGLQDQGTTLQFLHRVIFASICVFTIFFYCFFADRMTAKVRHVSFMMYDLPWYDMDIASRKITLQVIGQAQRPVRIRAGKFAYISLELFQKLMEAVYNMIAILLQMR